MNSAQLFPLLSLSKSLNTKYLKSWNALKQIMTKPLLLAKQRTGLTALQSKAKEWAVSYCFSVSLKILLMFWWLVKREGPVFAGRPQQWTAQHSILLPCATANWWGPGSWPKAVSPTRRGRRRQQWEAAPLCSGKIHVSESLQISEIFQCVMKLKICLPQLTIKDHRLDTTA